MDNQEQLKKLGRIFNSDKIVTNDDLTEVLKGVLSIMNSFKKDNEKLTSETKKEVDSLLNKVLEERDKIIEKVSSETLKTKDEVFSKLDKSVSDMQKMCEEMMLTKPEDGKDGMDADEEKIIEEVLAKIPKPQEIVLDDRQKIVEKINSGRKKDTKIDAQQITGLPEFTREVVREIGTSFTETPIKAGSNITVTKDASGSWVINSTASGTGGGHVIQDEGTPLTQRTNLNFVGGGVTVTDDAGNDATVVTISSTGGASTLADVSSFSTDATKSLYTMTSTIPVEFKTSGGTTALKIDEASGRVAMGTSTFQNAGLTISSSYDSTLALVSPDTWTGMYFADTGGSDYIFYYGATGSFSIGGAGSAISGKKLHIHGGTSIGSNLATTSVPTNGLLVEGNVGIGTTAPGEKLEVSGTGDVFARITSTDSNKAGIKLIRGTPSDSSVDFNIYDSGGALSFDSQGSGSATNLIYLGNASAPELRLLPSGGNVGIGTSAPGALLSVNGNATVGTVTPYSYAGTDVGLTIQGSGTYGVLALKAAQPLMKWVGTYNSGNGAELYQNTTGDFILNPNDATYGFKITATGNGIFGINTSKVGIGTETFGTNNKLLINAYNTVDNLATVQISTAAETNKGLVVQGYAGQTANLQEWQNSSGTALTVVDSAGNVGIGTVTPSAKLHSLATTEQLRLGYDASNYNAFTVGSTGTLTVAATGTNPNINLTPAGTGVVQVISDRFGLYYGGSFRSVAQYQNGSIIVNGGLAVYGAGNCASLPSTSQLVWDSTTDPAGNTKDTGLARSSAGVVKVTDGSTGYGSLATAHLYSGTLTTADALADNYMATSATTQKGLVIQGKASQTANLQEWQNSSGTALASITKDGYVSFNGNAAKSVLMERHTTANTAGNNLTIQSGGATSGATDKDGGILYGVPGLTTGTGKNSIRLQSLTRATSTGTSDNTLTDRFIVPSRFNLTNSSANALFTIALPTLSGAGANINFTIHCSDGTDIQRYTGRVDLSAVNKAGTYTTNINESSTSQSFSNGTLTTSWTITTGTNIITVNVTPTSSLTPTLYWIEYTIPNIGAGANAITQL